MDKSKSSLLPGFFLIGLGFILLVHELNLFYLDWTRTYPIIFILIGLTLFVSVIINKNSSVVFWGTIFFLFGFFFFLRNFDFIEYYHPHDIWPIFFIIFGIAFIVLFVVKPQDWGVLIPGCLFVLIGTTFLARNFHFWRVQEIVERYWSLLLIIIGIGIILGSLKKRR